MQLLVKRSTISIKIVWADPCGDSGHADASEMKELKPATMVSQAYIFDKDRKHVWTFFRMILSKLCFLIVIVFQDVL